MSFTDDNNLEIPTSGVADWDSPLNSNFTDLAKGFRFKAVAGLPVNTGNIVSVMSDGFVRPYDSSSLEAPQPRGASQVSLTSGEAGQFMAFGVMRSLDVFSSNLVLGQEIFVDPASPGMAVSSYVGARYGMGFNVDTNAILFRPNQGHLPEPITQVACLALVVGSAHAFTLPMGQRGISSNLVIVSDSVDAYKVQFHTGSARVASEEIYESVTTSVNGGADDFDISSLEFQDRSIWAYENTDTASFGIIFGLITVQSASNHGSSDMSITLTGERLL